MTPHRSVGNSLEDEEEQMVVKSRRAKKESRTLNQKDIQSQWYVFNFDTQIKR